MKAQSHLVCKATADGFVCQRYINPWFVGGVIAFLVISFIVIGWMMCRDFRE